MTHIPTNLLNAAGIITDPSARSNPIADYWYQHIQSNLPYTTFGAATLAPNPVAIANAMPHPTTVQQISKFQGEFMNWVKAPG